MLLAIINQTQLYESGARRKEKCPIDASPDHSNQAHIRQNHQLGKTIFLLIWMTQKLNLEVIIMFLTTITTKPATLLIIN